MSEAKESKGMWARVALYASVVIVCLSMLVMGALPKLLPGVLPGGPDMVGMWVNLYNLPLWFMTVTGVAELAAALLVLFKWTRILGGLLAAAIMLGAALVNIQAGEIGGLGVNAIVLAAALIVIWFHREQALKVLGRR